MTPTPLRGIREGEGWRMFESRKQAAARATTEPRRDPMP
jgi:hypothetical protein